MIAEIGIVGAGPAGARAAELLARGGAEVLLLDGRAPWEKPCGGGLPASAFDVMPELEALTTSARRIDAVRFEAAAGSGFPVFLDRPMYVVSRRDLARFQIDRAVAAGADWVRSTVRSIRREEDGWRLEGVEGNERNAEGARKHVWRIRRLVGADGAASRVRSAASPDLSVELAPTRVSYPGRAVPEPGTALVRLFEEVDGYFWDFSRPDHRSVGAGVEPGTWSRPRLDEEIDQYLRGTERDARAEAVSGTRTARSSRSGADTGTATSRTGASRTGAVIGTAALGHGDFGGVGGEDFALLGDAAGFADPATGEGIQNALRSAAVLADAYGADAGFSAYPSRVRLAMEKEFERSRLLRRILFDAGWGCSLVRRGERTKWARALVSAVMNSTNEHDLRVTGLLRRSAAALVE